MFSISSSLIGLFKHPASLPHAVRFRQAASSGFPSQTKQTTITYSLFPAHIGRPRAYAAEIPADQNHVISGGAEFRQAKDTQGNDVA